MRASVRKHRGCAGSGSSFFLIWAMTQTYADFDVQVAAVLGRDRLAPRDYQEATALITRLLLSGCGLPTNQARP